MLGERAEQDHAQVSRNQRGCHGFVLSRGRDAFERGSHVRWPGLALRIERRGEHGRQVLRHAEPVAGQAGRDREPHVVRTRVDERDLRAAAHGALADAVRDQRHFLAQVRADDQHARGLLDFGDGAAEGGRNRIVGLVAEIDATQAMVEVVRAERAGDPRGEREFFE